MSTRRILMVLSMVLAVSAVGVIAQGRVGTGAPVAGAGLAAVPGYDELARADGPEDTPALKAAPAVRPEIAASPDASHGHRRGHCLIRVLLLTLLLLLIVLVLALLSKFIAWCLVENMMRHHDRCGCPGAQRRPCCEKPDEAACDEGKCHEHGKDEPPAKDE